MKLRDGEEIAATLAAPGARAEGPELTRVEKEMYEVGEELARGGLGRIMQAVDRRLDRPVAIKELLRDDPDHAARFAREALLTAKLQHPAIVPVYEAGLWPDGSPFYAMKLVSGKSLEAAVREKETLAERLTLLPHVIHVVEALAYAHDRKIIHRDLKPANVLVGAFGETVVIDWGLAKDLSAPVPEAALVTGERPAGERPPRTGGSSGHTEAGSVLGTPAYMPPEQAMGHVVDSRADVYALGALLYHVISGGPPYSGVTSQEILTAVAHLAPESLEDKEPGAPRELCAIVYKAMARLPDDRYPTAGELAEDLLRFQRGLLVTAHEYSTATLVLRWVKKHRAPLFVAVAMLALLVAVVVVDVNRIVTERDRARTERAEAQRLRTQADMRGDELALREAEALLARDPGAALGWLQRLTPESHAWGAARVIAADALARGIPRIILSDLQAGALAPSPDGALVAAARADDVVLIDTATLQRITLAGRGGDERALVFSPGGGKLAYASSRGGVRLWDRSVRGTTDLPSENEVTALAFAGDERLVAGDGAGGLHVWLVGQKAEARLAEAHGGAVLAIDARPGRAVTGGADGVARLWELGDAGPKLIATLPHGAAVTAVRFLPDGETVTVAADRRVRRWDSSGGFAGVLGDHEAQPTALAVEAVAGGGVRMATGDARGDVIVWGARPVRLAGHADEVRALVFAGDGLYSAGRDGTIRVWNLTTGGSRTLLGHEGGIVALASAGGRLVSAARDRTVRFWDPHAGQPRVLSGAGAARALAASADGRWLATGAAGGEVRLWDVSSGKATALGSAGAEIREIAFAPDGAGFVTGGADGKVLLYTMSGKVPAGVTSLPGPVAAVSFDLRSRQIAAGGAGGLRVVDLSSGKERLVVDERGEPVAGVAFTPGGTMLAAVGRAVRLWDVDRGRARLLSGTRGPFSSVACSTQLVAAGHNDGVTLWRIASGVPTPLFAAGGPFTSLTFTPDGKRLVGRGERAARIWDIATGESRPLEGATGIPLSLVVSNDGRSAAMASSDGTVRVWDLASARGRTLHGHTGAATGVALLAGTIATTGVDGTVRLWPDDLPYDPAMLRARLTLRQ